jgi:methionyl-tRNA formyltransferase
MPQPDAHFQSLRVLYLGQPCVASAPPLTALLAAGYQMTAVVLTGQPSVFPSETERLANEQNIPLHWVASAEDAASILRASAPDVAVAACFPWRLGKVAREASPLGILNVHPSLLPTGRGAEPVFWTLRRGEPVTGATVHRMDAGFDTGPIVAQAKIEVPAAIRAPELERQLMTLGGTLLVQALPALAAGTLHPWPQPQQGITLAPVPTPADWTMTTILPAAWAWRFARGVAPLGGPLTVVTPDAVIPVTDALDWSPLDRLPERVIDNADGTIRVRFSPGWIRFERTLAPVRP